jgi:DNA-binding GntR family transcriptional regulator
MTAFSGHESMIVRKTLHDELFPLLCNLIVEGELDSGASVVCITQQEAEELIPLLGTIESHASELACVRIDAARIAHIKKLHGQLLENHRAGSEQERPSC